MQIEIDPGNGSIGKSKLDFSTTFSGGYSCFDVFDISINRRRGCGTLHAPSHGYLYDPSPSCAESGLRITQRLSLDLT